MDQITAALNEYLKLTEMNLKDRNVIEGAMRARALQEISVLDTERLAEMARRVTLRVSHPHLDDTQPLAGHADNVVAIGLPEPT